MDQFLKICRKFALFLAWLLALPVTYLIIALILGTIPVNTDYQNANGEKHIYLNTNGVHLNIIFPKESLDTQILKDLKVHADDRYLAFGWGDKQFYLNTPYWSDLEFKTAVNAMFRESETLMHYTRFPTTSEEWIKIPLSNEKLQRLNGFILNSFQTTSGGNKILLPGKGYSDNDHFYEAEGYYTCFYTSNTWVNHAFKESGLKACTWTPFDFSLMNKYDKR